MTRNRIIKESDASRYRFRNLTRDIRAQRDISFPRNGGLSFTIWCNNAAALNNAHCSGSIKLLDASVLVFIVFGLERDLVY